MTNSNRKLGIIAGGGSIPQMLIEKCQKDNIPFSVLAIEGNADKDFFQGDNFDFRWIRLGQAGSGFKYFAQNKVTDVVMIGTICRPSLHDLLPDMRTTAFLAKVGMKALGDDGILRAIASEIEKDGMHVKGIHEIMPDLLIPSGILTKHKPSKEDMIDIKRGAEVAYTLGQLDVGQSVVVQQGLVLGVEGIEGTDKLIMRCKEYKRKGKGGVLVKLRKPQQDMRLDLPTIGMQTIENAHNSGLKGIAVHTGNGLIVEQAKTIALADKYGMFIIGVNPNDYLA